MVFVGLCAVAFAKYSYGDAGRTSAQMRRAGLPRALSTVAGYRVAALLMGAFGVMFITLAVVVE
jgi:hypothetical protein